MNSGKRGRPKSEELLRSNGLTETQWDALQKLGRSTHLPAVYFLREAVDEYLTRIQADSAPAGHFQSLPGKIKV